MSTRTTLLTTCTLSLLTAALIIGGCGSDTPSEFGPEDTNSSSGASPSSSSGGGGPAIPTGDGGPRDDNSDASDEPGVIKVTIRDFQHWLPDDSSRNPDFENVPQIGPNGETPYYGSRSEGVESFILVSSGQEVEPDYRMSIVKDELDADRKPIYNTDASYNGTMGRTATTHGQQSFNDWFHDSPRSKTIEIELRLTNQGNGVYVYDSAESGVPRGTDGLRQFFPIEGQGWGNTPRDPGNPDLAELDERLDHNYHFTTELHTLFTYAGNESFTFTGDDDIFVYINKKLVLNIGGIHDVARKTISLPELAESIGLEVGKEYPFDLFQAERHVIGSNVRIETTIQLRADPSIIN